MKQESYQIMGNKMRLLKNLDDDDVMMFNDVDILMLGSIEWTPKIK